MGKSSLNLLKGTLDLLILKTVSLEPLHGYEIAKWVRRASGEAFDIEYGALYQALLRLEGRGWLTTEWRESPTGREVRFYQPSPEGRRQLTRQTADWDRYVVAMDRVLRTTEA
jgi:PadR family transcriptional regulator PadR